MEKADLLESAKCELDLILQKVEDPKKKYDMILQIVQQKVSHYRTLCLYLTNETAFYYFGQKSDQEENCLKEIPFGEEILSIVAARGEISYDIEPGVQVIYIPFYKRHHLLGELVIKSTKFIDEAELSFVKYLQELLNG